jgi:hypothetical protein
MIFKIYNLKMVSWYDLLRISIFFVLRPCIVIGGDGSHIGADKIPPIGSVVEVT